MPQIEIQRTFNTKWRRKYRLPHTDVGERVVETAGYIPLKTRIENMVAAGMRLQEAREEMYPDDFTDDQLLSQLDEEYPDFEQPDEISIMTKGLEAEEKLYRRKPKKKAAGKGLEDGGENPKKAKKQKSETLSDEPGDGAEGV